MSNQPYLKERLLVYSKTTVIVNGYVIPAIAVVVVVTNVFVILVYRKQYQQTQNKVRKISSILYISIATANTLSSLPTSIWYFYLFTLNNRRFVPYGLCWTWNFFIAFDTFPHMVSIWLVTILSVQRFTVIRHPFISLKQWTIKRMVVMVTIILIITFLMQVPHAVDTIFEPREIFLNESTNTSAGVGCRAYYASWLNGNGITMEITWYVLKLIGVVIIPSIFIIYSDVSLILFLRESTNVRKHVARTSRETREEKDEFFDSAHSDKQRFKNDLKNAENRHQTLLVVILSSIVFIVEIPYAVLLLAYIYYLSTRNFYKVREYWIGPVGNVVSLTMHVSYPTLFILSCLFSRQFRMLLLNMFKTQKRKFHHKTIELDHTISMDT